MDAQTLAAPEDHPAPAKPRREGGYRIGMPYVGDRFGGSNLSSLVMAQALTARGHKPVVITHGPGRAADEARDRGLEVLTVKPLSDLPGYARPDRARLEQLKPFMACHKLVRSLDLDIVHTNDMTMLRTWAAPAKAAGAALIGHWRTAVKPSLSVSAALALSDRIVSVSQYSKDVLPAWARGKCIVEYNALDTFFAPERRAQARGEIRERLGLPPNAILVAIFANLMKRKRCHMLADIIKAVTHNAQGAPVYGLMCGGRAEPADLLFDEKVAAFGLGERILQPGFVRPSDVWMAACDVIVAPAEKEPLARNILEAAAIGVPVVVSADGGLAEIVEDGVTGVVLPPEDTDAWVAVVQRMIDEPRWAADLADKGQAAVRRLTPALHAERIEGIYRAVKA